MYSYTGSWESVIPIPLYCGQIRQSSMTDLIARFEDNKFVVYSNDNIVGWVAFDGNQRVSADLMVSGDIFRAEPESAKVKDIVLRQGADTLFKFKFNYLWGGAEIQTNGEDTGYDIKGKLFKPGTRLVDAEENDLVVVVTESPETRMRINVVSSEVSPLMVMATLYYHIYTSAANSLMLMMSGVIGQ
jgi:hypothetical protein